jgi:hypothetical protein
MSRTATRQLATCLGAVVLTLALVECNPTLPPSPPVVARPECPVDSILIPRDSGYTVTTVIPASGPISLVPEYHDCQRMLSSNKSAYGSLIAVFARSGLDSIPDPPAVRGTLNRVVYFAAEQAAATILNYDGPYDPLHIESGINCLYLYAINGKWAAHIIKTGDEHDCLKPLSSFTGGTDLKVNVIGDKDVPPVARWDWDDRHREQYIGIRCGTQWCEVYNPSNPALASSARYVGPPKVSVKGWYDEQVLAVNGPSTGPILVPGGVVGTIFPIGDLAQNPESVFTTWKPVARVSLAAPSPAYLAKFSFVVGPPPDAKSVVSLCMGTRDACHVPSTANVTPCNQGGDPWWARIESGTDANSTIVGYHCVIRRKHSGVSIPGVVRWRWQTTDDDMWIRCPVGCCQVT